MSAETLHTALLNVWAQARREKVPGPLARTMLDISYKVLDLCQCDERCAAHFASMVLSGPTNLRETTGRLPPNTAHACWRLIALLEYLSNGRQ